LNRKNIFVFGLEPYNLSKLQGIHNSDQYRFHSPLEYDEVVKPLDYPYEEMLQKAERQLRDFPGTIDAIISHWDFSADTMLPILCRKFDLKSPSLEKVLMCGHKYWSRLEQQKYIPEYIPDFCAFRSLKADFLIVSLLDKAGQILRFLSRFLYR